MEIFILFITGIVVGLLGALLGIGGGVVMVPVLVLILKVPIHQAVAASLVAILATSSQVASFGIRHRLTNLRLAIFLDISTVFGAIISSWFAVKTPTRLLEWIFALTLIIVAGLMWFRLKMKYCVPENADTGYWGGTFFDPDAKTNRSYRVKRLPQTFGLVFLAGIFSGMVGTSGGIFKVPILNLLSGVPIRVATETSSFMIGLTALGGVLTYYFSGFVDPHFVAPLVVGVLLGSNAGNYLSHRIHKDWLTILFIVLLIITSLKMSFLR